MLTKTSISAIRALLLLAGQRNREPWSPRRLAETLDESPTYMAKVVRHLVKVGILRAHHGAKGGVLLAREPAKIPLRDIVEACQGAIVGDYCQSSPGRRPPCTFHRASLELHQAITSVLDRWTLAALLAEPFSGNELCLMAGVPKPTLIRDIPGPGSTRPPA